MEKGVREARRWLRPHLRRLGMLEGPGKVNEELGFLP